MSKVCNFFISYCHEDEFLKNELKAHLAGISRQGKITIWDDRRLVVGEDLDDEVLANLYDADVFVMLVSSDFINSNYCMSVEYAEAKKLKAQGKLEIAPIIVRHCNWHTDKIDKIVCIPEDGIPVNGDGYGNTEKTKRDKSWTSVVSEINKLLEKLSILNSPIIRNTEYLDSCRKTVSVKHPDSSNIRLSQIYTQPDIRINGKQEYIENDKSFLKFLKRSRLSFISGDDACGKTTLFLQCQKSFLAEGIPAIIINGNEIKNLDVERKINSELQRQLEPREYKKQAMWVFLDDFESSTLSEKLQNKLIDELVETYAGVVVSSFTSFQSMQMLEADGVMAQSAEIVPLSPDKIYQLVVKWVSLGNFESQEEIEHSATQKFQTLIQMVGSGSIPTFPSYLLNFLEVMETISARDISATANASCYDALITVRLANAHIPSSDIDSYKLFFCHLAFQAYKQKTENYIDDDVLQLAYESFTSEYFDPPTNLLQKSIDAGLISETDKGYMFSIEFIWFFFVGQYLAKELFKQDVKEFDNEVKVCIENIHQRLYANIILFCSYFLSDNRLIGALVNCLDSKFSEVEDWKLNRVSQKSMNSSKEVLHLTQKPSDASEARIKALQEENRDIIRNSEKVVESYLHPFSIGQSRMDDIEESASFMGQVNSLFRIQSILSQVLSTRSGTFKRDTVILTVDAMIKASGRFCRLNLSVAEQIIADPDGWILGVKEAFPNDDLTTEARSNKLLKIFSFWSVVLSQGGVARLLREPHSIAALKILHKEHELGPDNTLAEDEGFNFSSVLCVAELWSSGKIDKEKIQNLVTLYGKESSFTEMLRFSLFVFSHYNSIDPTTRQWLSSSMNIHLKSTRYAQRKLPVPKMDNAIGRKRREQDKKEKRKRKRKRNK